MTLMGTLFTNDDSCVCRLPAFSGLRLVEVLAEPKKRD